MCRLFWAACLACVATTAFGQPAPKPKPALDPSFLIEGLNHASPAIRLRSSQLLTDEAVDATPGLVDAVLRADDLPAVRAGVVLTDRMLRLRRVKAAGPPRVSLTPAERQQVRRLLAVIKDPRAEPWRWYLATYLVDKLDPASLPELLGELRVALLPGQPPMKQYAAVQAIFRLGLDGRAAEDELWALLESRPCFRGLYVARRAIDDDLPAFTHEIGIYNLLLGLERSYVISDLLVLETLRLVGAPGDRLTGALAHLAHHESQEVRLDVARQLGLVDDAARAIAADVLIGLLGEPESVLRALLADENADTREEAIGLFTQLGPAAVKTVPVLTELLAAKENRVRFSAAVILGRIGPPAASALPALRRALAFERLREGDDYQAMAEAIDRITGKAKAKP
jgi:hypothetical protein